MIMKLKFAPLLLIAVTLMSCSNRLVGVWTIQKYETTTPTQQSTSLMNIGTMTFHNNGNGVNNINYSVFGVAKEDKSTFKWTQSDTYVTIESQGSEFAKTWIIVKNERKYQKWQSTDGNKQVQVLELKK